MNDLLQRLDQLSPSQRKLLKLKLLPIQSDKQEGQAQIHAFVIGDSKLSMSELQAHAKTDLPEYMVPHSITALSAFPLLPNGKLDRHALLEQVTAVSPTESSYAPPRNELEQQLVAIWSEVLNIEMIGIQDNFFEIGGDSILSIQIIAQARKMGLSFSPNQLFEYQTIAALAPMVHIISDSASEPVKKETSNDSLPTGFAESGLSVEELNALLDQLD